MSKPKPKSPAAKRSYKVGPGKPPLATQFKPGQSGNPAGRPKGSCSLKAAFDRAASAVTDVPGVSCETGKFTLLEAMMIRLFRAAMRGDMRAAERLIELARDFPSAGDGEDGSEIRLRWMTEDERPAEH